MPPERHFPPPWSDEEQSALLPASWPDVGRHRDCAGVWLPGRTGDECVPTDLRFDGPDDVAGLLPQKPSFGAVRQSRRLFHCFPRRLCCEACCEKVRYVGSCELVAYS